MSKTAFSTPDITTFCHFCTGCTTLQKFQAKCTVCTEQCFQPKVSPFFQLCTGRTSSYPFFAKCTSLCKTGFPSRRSPRFDILTLDVPRFSHFGKVHEFVQDSLLIRRSARFVIFALGKLLFSGFRQSTRVCKKTSFSTWDEHVLSFSHWVHYFLAIFCKLHEFVQNNVFSLRPVRFVIFALGALPFRYFQQSARVCTRQSFQNEISMFSHSRTGRTTF